MNRQMNNFNFFSTLSPSIKLISTITFLGYLLSFSETAVNVSIDCRISCQKYPDLIGRETVFYFFWMFFNVKITNNNVLRSIDT